MKKAILFILAVMLILFITACGVRNTPLGDDSNTVAAEPSATITDVVINPELRRILQERVDIERRFDEIEAEINTPEFERLSGLAQKSVLDNIIMLIALKIEKTYEIINLYESLIAQNIIKENRTQSDDDELEQMNIGLEIELRQLGLWQTKLEVHLVRASTIISQLMESLDDEIELYDMITAEADLIQQNINAAVAEAANQAEALMDTDSLIWPIQCGYIVSRHFGSRLHPVFGVQRMHSGIDILAGHGENIISAYGGMVIVSGYNLVYGLYVVIYHGNGIATLYAHMSRCFVDIWQIVEKGDVIGQVGSTGISTGPHLHFEIFVDGSRQDPLAFFIE